MGLKFPKGKYGCQTTEGCKLWLTQKTTTGFVSGGSFFASDRKIWGFQLV
jgi:hypothetical protein